MYKSDKSNKTIYVNSSDGTPFGGLDKDVVLKNYNNIFSHGGPNFKKW